MNSVTKAELASIAQMGVPQFDLEQIREVEQRIADQTQAHREAASAQCRSAVDAIKAIPPWAFDEKSLAWFCAVLSAKVSSSGWGHLEAGEVATSVLDGLHDDLAFRREA
jgi:hypothetical protein